MTYQTTRSQQLFAEAQTWLAKQTLRRPVNAEVAASLKDAPQNTVLP